MAQDSGSASCFSALPERSRCLRWVPIKKNWALGAQLPQGLRFLHSPEKKTMKKYVIFVWATCRSRYRLWTWTMGSDASSLCNWWTGQSCCVRLRAGSHLRCDRVVYKISGRAHADLLEHVPQRLVVSVEASNHHLMLLGLLCRGMLRCQT